MGNRVANKPLIAYTHPRFFRHPAQALCKTSGSGHLRHPSRSSFQQIVKAKARSIIRTEFPVLDAGQKRTAIRNLTAILLSLWNGTNIDVWSKGERWLETKIGIGRKTCRRWLRVLVKTGILTVIKKEHYRIRNGECVDRFARVYRIDHGFHLALCFASKPPKPRSKTLNDCPSITLIHTNVAETYGFRANRELLAMRNASVRQSETKTENQKGENRGIEKIYSLFLKYPWLKDDPRYERFWGLMSRDRRQVIYNRLWYLRRSLKATKITKSTPLDRLPKAQKHWLLKNASLGRVSWQAGYLGQPV